MKKIEWNEEKNRLLMLTRGVCFEYFIDDIRNKNYIISQKKSRPNQKIFVVRFDNYPFCIPFVEDEEKIFLKTIYPDRKFKKWSQYDK